MKRLLAVTLLVSVFLSPFASGPAFAARGPATSDGFTWCKQCQ